MKILFITDLYPIKTGEYTTPHTLHNFVSQWQKTGHNVTVIKPNFILNSFLRKKPFYKTGAYEYEGVRIFNLNYFTPFLFDITKKNSDLLNASNYDIIIAHMPSGIIFANKLAKKFNKPLICAVHCSDIEVLTNPIYSLYFRKELKNAYNNAKKIACRSFNLQKSFSKIMPECNKKTFVINSGISLNSNSDKILEQKRSFTSVITCANLIKRKNIDKLILAVKSLEEFELKIIGDGKELTKLKKIKGGNIKFLGRLKNEDVLKEMLKSDIFILPSINETFGMVYLEAMASGCITVCTKNDGIDGIIKDNENGFLCEPTVEGIKQVLLKIKTHPELNKILKNSIETIKKYTPENCANDYINNCL